MSLQKYFKSGSTHGHKKKYTASFLYSTGCAAHLAIKPVQWHGGIGQADHAYPSSSNIRQHRLVSGFPLILLAAELSVLILDASALAEEERLPT